MKRAVCLFLVATLHIVSWMSAASRPSAPHDGAHHQDTGQMLLPPQVAFDTKQGFVSIEEVNKEEEAYKGLSRLGSRPPNCEHKCGHCRPCIAIQVPKTNEHLGVQYANYEPEGWKCKCGPTFFNP